MSRVSASDAVILLHQEADRTGNSQYRVTKATLRKWVQRGRISRGEGGYDLHEITAYLDKREQPPTA